jgi:Zn-dependent M28 family amino/carboxypeptidase
MVEPEMAFCDLDGLMDIEEQFISLGYSVSVQSFRVYGVETANIIAYPESFDPAKPIHLLGAHFDTVTGTPGADDNASAVSVLLECARLVAENDSRGGNTLFVAFSAEEPPAFGTSLMGSRVFVRSLKESGWNIDGALVLEMVGYYTDKPKSQKIPIFLKFKGFSTTGNFIAVIGSGKSKKLVQEIVTSVKRAGKGLPVENLAVPGSGYLVPETRLSDNASFWDAGIPAVMITDTSFLRNPHYHMRSDTSDTLDYESMEKLTLSLTDYFLSTV